MDINPEDDRAQTKNKKKREKSNIRLKAKGDKKKRHHSGATAEVCLGISRIFPAAANTASSTSLSVGVGMILLLDHRPPKREASAEREVPL